MVFRFLGKETFSYIDIGANDPYNGSNTAYLYAHGCRGICIEPNPDLIASLKQERPEDIVLNVGVAPQSGKLPYYMFQSNVFNTFSEAISKVAEKRCRLKEIREVSVTTLDEIIRQHSQGIYPDFLQVDIEGLDYDVLKSCDFTHSSPTVICTELDGMDMRKTTEMLDVKGYFPFHRSMRDMIYIRKDVKDKYPDIALLS
jgi:FkbM family methyltransferase